MAFFDNRVMKPAIILNIMKHDRSRIYPRLYLSVVYDSNKRLCTPLNVWIRTGTYRTRKQRYYISYSLRTVADLQLNTVPVHVMFTEDIYCKHALSAKIPIYPRHKNKKFGVCLHQALYNIKKAQTIVDWIVIHQLMGIEIIFIYLEMKYEPEFLPKAIEPFVSSGLVELIDWSIGVETDDYGQFGVIQDCIFRSIGNVEYLALYDIDEILVPYKHLKWIEMLKELESIVDVSNYGSLKFENYIWYHRGVEIDMPYQYITCSKVHKPVFFKRTQRSIKKSPTKIMIRPAVVDSCWIHYALDTKPNVLHEYSVPMSIGSIHHYRQHINHYVESVLDDGMKRFVNGTISIIKRLQCGHDTAIVTYSQCICSLN